MKATLWKLLEGLGYEVYEQGSLTDEENYPDDFFTVWNDDTLDNTHYDNKAVYTEWAFTIHFYSISPFRTVEMINKAKEILKKNKWIVPGKGRDVGSNSKNHSGRMIEAYFMENNEEGNKNG